MLLVTPNNCVAKLPLAALPRSSAAAVRSRPRPTPSVPRQPTRRRKRLLRAFPPGHRRTLAHSGQMREVEADQNAARAIRDTEQGVSEEYKSKVAMSRVLWIGSAHEESTHKCIRRGRCLPLRTPIVSFAADFRKVTGGLTPVQHLSVEATRILSQGA